jgi:uncharacterized protein (TIGR02118 family)
MTRFLVLYRQPTDVEAFERHYLDVHVPLAKQLPGLRRYAISRNSVVVRGGERYYLVAELDWDDMASLQRDFASTLGRATADDMENLEALSPGVQSMILELEDL